MVENTVVIVADGEESRWKLKKIASLLVGSKTALPVAALQVVHGRDRITDEKEDRKW